MEKIVSLEKERKERNISSCLSYDNKIKLNINLENEQFFNKAVKEISKKVIFKENMRKKSFQEKKNYLENLTKHFQIEIELLKNNEAKLIELIGEVYNKYSRKNLDVTDILEYTKKLIPIQCTIKDNFGNQFSFYSILLDRIGAKTNKYLFYHGNGKVRIIDIFTAISEVFIINEIVNYYNKNNEICKDSLNLIIETGACGKYTYTKGYLKYLDELLNEGSDFLLNLKNTFNINKKTDSASISGYSKEAIGTLFKEMAFDNEDIVLLEEQLTQMNSDYARAFEEKKNINKETLKAMEKSNFNKYFKEVEFDNDVDLNKTAQLELEFKDTLNFINPSDSIMEFMKNVSLRFRYLGKHKATGLYFPFHKTMCIDLRTPNSFLHEFMHMVDYHNYKNNRFKFSSKYDFRKIVKKYIEVLDKTINELPENHFFKKKYNGRSKYNRNYYCNSAEIFARCGEIYFYRILNINNSLIKDFSKETIDYAYPKDKELDNMVSEYYKQFFNIENEYKISAMSTNKTNIINKKITKIETKITSSGQLSFI